MAYNFPNYFQRAPVMGNDPFATVKWKVWNRAGVTTAIGSVYMFDMTMSQTETTTFNWMDAASVWRNIVATGTVATGTGTSTTPTTFIGMYCVANEVAADNTELEVTVQGVVSVNTVTASAIQFYPKWCALTPTSGQVYSTIQPGSQILSSKNIGRTLVAVDQGSTSSPSTRSCLFSGFGQLL